MGDTESMFVEVKHWQRMLDLMRQAGGESCRPDFALDRLEAALAYYDKRQRQLREEMVAMRDAAKKPEVSDEVS